MQTFRRWNKKSIEDDGMYMSKEAKSFFRAFKNFVQRCFPDAELIGFEPNHYDTSGFIKKDGKYIYVSYTLNRGNQCRPDFSASDALNGVLYRTADGPKDYRGGSNHFTSIDNFKRNVQALFDVTDPVDEIKESVMARLMSGVPVRQALSESIQSVNEGVSYLTIARYLLSQCDMSVASEMSEEEHLASIVDALQHTPEVIKYYLQSAAENHR